MKRTSNHSAMKPCELILPTSIVDFLATLVLVFAVNPDVNRLHLPTLRRDDAAATQTTDGRSGYLIELKADGTVHYEGKPVPIDRLASRVAAEPHHDRPIQVCLETTADGRGAMQAWIRLQADLTEAKLWNRVQVLTRSKQSQARVEDSLP